MVRRQRLLLTPGSALLSALPSALLSALILVACPAEQLGVELPRGGPEAISQEDLRRDIWLIEQAGSAPAAALAVSQRLSQMRLLPAYGSQWVASLDGGTVVCGRKDGSDPQAVLIIAAADPSTPAGAVTWAGLVSLAKGWDLPGQPERTRILCVCTEPPGGAGLAAAPPVPVDGLGAIVTLGPIHGASLSAERTGGQPPRLELAAPGASLERVGQVDYRGVEANLRQAIRAIDALP